MAVPDKIEAVKKAVEVATKQANPAEEVERLSPNKDKFDNLMQSSQQSPNAIKPPGVEKIHTQGFATSEVQAVEKNQNPIFMEENTSTGKSGTATDQEKKGKQDKKETEGVGKVSKKASSSDALMQDMSKLNKNVSSISRGGDQVTIKTQAKEAIAEIEKLKTKLASAQGEIKPSYQSLLKNRLSHIDDSLKIALNKAGVEYTPPPAAPSGENKSPLHKIINQLTQSQHHLENFHLNIEQAANKGEITTTNMLVIQMKMAHVTQQIELFSNLLNKALESMKTVMNVQV